jgi:hypothetical protein
MRGPDEEKYINLLLEIPKFQNAIGKIYQETKDQPFNEKQIPKEIHEIMGELADFIKEKAAEKIELSPNKEMIRKRGFKVSMSQSTLERLFEFREYDKGVPPNPNHKTRKLTLDTIEFFLGIHKELNNANIQVLDFDALKGYWYVYRVEGFKGAKNIVRTVMHIYEGNDNKLKADFRSLSTSFKGGEVLPGTQTLNLMFKEDSKVIEITTRLSADILSRQEKVLNALLRSVKDDDPYTKNTILRRMNGIVDQSPEEVKRIYTSEDPNKEIEDKAEYSIARFLLRKRGLFAKQFVPSTVDSVSTRNFNYYNSAGRRNYKSLKGRFSGKWYSISTDVDDLTEEVRDRKFAINKYTFYPNDIEGTITWSCTRGDSEETEKPIAFGGTVIQQYTQIIFSQEEIQPEQNLPHYENMNSVGLVSNRKQLVALTTFLKGSKSYSVLEYFFKCDDEDLVPHSMSYQQLIDFAPLSSQEKSYIVERTMHEISWNDFSHNYNFLSKYSGKYFLYVKDSIYKDAERSGFLRKSTLEIDALGYVKEIILYKDAEILRFFGRTMIMKNNTLKLSCENKDGRLNYYLFKIDMGWNSPKKILAGINLSVHLGDSIPYAGNCLLVKLEQSDKFEPAIIGENSDDFKKVDKQLKENKLPAVGDFFKSIDKLGIIG